MIGSIGSFADQGDVESRRRAREELRRQQRRHLAEHSNWPRLNLDELRFERRWVVHEPTGKRYRLMRGEVDGLHTPVTAWAIGRGGETVFLEPV